MKKIIRIFFMILCFVFACLSFYSITKIGVLPTKYVYASFGVIFTGLFLVELFLFLKRIGFHIVGYILGILFLIGNGSLIYYLYQTDYFLNQSFSGKVIEKTNYYLVTYQDNMDELDSNGNVLYYDKMYQKDSIIDLLKSNYDFTFTSYESLNTIIDSIIEKTEKYMLIEGTSYHIMEELDTRISDNLKILKEFSIEQEKKTKEINQQLINIYIVGNDFSGLNDFNMIVTVNRAKKKILLTTITRDFRVPVYGYDGIEDNLEYLAPLGVDTSIRSLEDFFDITIDYYVRINVDSVVKMVDAIGGITYCSDYDYMSTTTNPHNKNGRKFHVIKGCQEVDGLKALAIARERKKIPGSDFARQDNIRKILLAIFDKMKSSDVLLHYKDLLESLSDSYETTIPRSFIEEMAQKTLKNDSKWIIEENSVWGEEIIGYVHLGTVRDYTVVPDQESVQNAKDKIINLGKD